MLVYQKDLPSGDEKLYDYIVILSLQQIKHDYLI